MGPTWPSNDSPRTAATYQAPQLPQLLLAARLAFLAPAPQVEQRNHVVLVARYQVVGCRPQTHLQVSWLAVGAGVKAVWQGKVSMRCALLMHQPFCVCHSATEEITLSPSSARQLTYSAHPFLLILPVPPQHIGNPPLLETGCRKT